MSKLNSKKTVATVVVTITILGFGVAGVLGLDEGCGKEEIELGFSDGVICMEQQEYADLKLALHEDYSEGKDYDFDINNRSALSVVIEHEAEKRGVDSFMFTSKADLKEQLINLLSD